MAMIGPVGRRSIVVVLLLAACARGPRIVPVDAAASFALHQEGRRFYVDKPAATPAATIGPATLLRGPGDPMFAWRDGERVRAAYWLTGTNAVTVRQGPALTAATRGRVVPSWDDNAIRLRLEPPEGEVYLSDVFVRVEPGVGPRMLSRVAATVLDVRGTYRAVLRDTAGAEVGWLRVRVGPYQPSERVYDAVLPDRIENDLAVAAMLALASEITWIESQSYDVYQGRTGPLDQSFPME